MLDTALAEGEPAGAIADRVAAAVLPDADLRQSLLETLDVTARVNRVAAAVEALVNELKGGAHERRRRALTALALVLLVLAPLAEARSWAWLGVRICDLSEQETEELSKRHGIREGFGVVIVDATDDTPAARAGMKNGDIVVAFEGRPITETRLLQRLIARAPVDQDIRLTVLRTEGRRPVAVRLVTMPRPVAGERVRPIWFSPA